MESIYIAEIHVDIEVLVVILVLMESIYIKKKQQHLTNAL